MGYSVLSARVECLLFCLRIRPHRTTSSTSTIHRFTLAVGPRVRREDEDTPDKSPEPHHRLYGGRTGHRTGRYLPQNPDVPLYRLTIP